LSVLENKSGFPEKSNQKDATREPEKKLEGMEVRIALFGGTQTREIRRRVGGVNKFLAEETLVVGAGGPQFPFTTAKDDRGSVGDTQKKGQGKFSLNGYGGAVK